VIASRDCSSPSACSKLTLFGTEKTKSKPATGAKVFRSSQRRPVAASILSTVICRFGEWERSTADVNGSRPPINRPS
jgi:hypothetical protein